jgi:protein-S-isoprenylcysteine O-methyltransferase Ste14
MSFWLPQATILWKRKPIFCIGIGLMLVGIAFRWYSASLLGKYFTFDVAIHSGQTLIEVGPYRYIRHSSYTGALVSLLGFGLALGELGGGVVGVSCLSMAYAYRIPVEEAALASALAETYQQYLGRTWRRRAQDQPGPFLVVVFPCTAILSSEFLGHHLLAFLIHLGELMPLTHGL